ncbi:MAG: hypothetical protein R3352_07275, partial [Salinisphaeraceae bacterium]|nr:hypothetical protein [Salinisphaeraceae bacterium]
MTSNQRLISVAITVGSGLWLIVMLSSNTLTGLVGTILAALLVLCGAAWWLAEQARRLGQYTAWLGLLIALTGLLGIFQLPWSQMIIMLLLGITVMLLAGFASVWRIPLPEGI